MDQTDTDLTPLPTPMFLTNLFPFCPKVQMHNGDVYEANIRDIDKKSDIATIKINPQVSQQARSTLDVLFVRWLMIVFHFVRIHAHLLVWTVRTASWTLRRVERIPGPVNREQFPLNMPFGAGCQTHSTSGRPEWCFFSLSNQRWFRPLEDSLDELLHDVIHLYWLQHNASWCKIPTPAFFLDHWWSTICRQADSCCCGIRHWYQILSDDQSVINSMDEYGHLHNICNVWAIETENSINVI